MLRALGFRFLNCTEIGITRQLTERENGIITESSKRVRPQNWRESLTDSQNC